MTTRVTSEHLHTTATSEGRIELAFDYPDALDRGIAALCGDDAVAVASLTPGEARELAEALLRAAA